MNERVIKTQLDILQNLLIMNYNLSKAFGCAMCDDSLYLPNNVIDKTIDLILLEIGFNPDDDTISDKFYSYFDILDNPQRLIFQNTEYLYHRVLKFHDTLQQNTENTQNTQKTSICDFKKRSVVR